MIEKAVWAMTSATDMDTSPELDMMLACELLHYTRTKPQVLRLQNLCFSLLKEAVAGHVTRALEKMRLLTKNLMLRGACGIYVPQPPNPASLSNM